MGLKIAINGALGRMGRRIAVLAADAGHEIVAAIDTGASGAGYGDAIGDRRLGCAVAGSYEGGAEVLIDFSLPGGLEARIAECESTGTALVSGTTGLNDAQKARLEQAAGAIPVLWAPNMSLGVNLLFSLVEEAAGRLDSGYDIEIVEMHHRNKVDAPSGTAIGLLQAAAQGRGLDPDQAARHGREGNTGKRTADEIGMHSLRGGGEPGEHTVLFASDGEQISLSHKALSRDTFALGAIKAAEWIAGKAPGRYTMKQVLGL